MKWDIQSGIAYPYPGVIPEAIGYLREYIAYSAYIQRRGTNEPEKVYKAMIYSTLRTMDKSNNINQEMSIKNFGDRRIGVRYGKIYEWRQYPDPTLLRGTK